MRAKIENEIYPDKFVYIDVYIQFDLISPLLHLQPVKVSLGVPLQGFSLNIVLFLD